MPVVVVGQDAVVDAINGRLHLDLLEIDGFHVCLFFTIASGNRMLLELFFVTSRKAALRWLGSLPPSRCRRTV